MSTKTVKSRSRSTKKVVSKIQTAEGYRRARSTKTRVVKRSTRVVKKK